MNLNKMPVIKACLRFLLYRAAITFCLSPTLAIANINIPLYEKGTDVFYLKAHLTGYGDSEFMLDIGSGPSAVASDILTTLKQAGKASWSHNSFALLANGERQTFRIYRIHSLQLNDSCTLKNIEAAELPAGTRNIIGINLLKQTAPFSINTDPMVLSLGTCKSHSAIQVTSL